MPQLLARYDDCLKITVVAPAEVGLDKTDVNSGHRNVAIAREAQSSDPGRVLPDSGDTGSTEFR